MDKIVIFGGKGSAVVIAEQIYDRQEKIGDIEFLGFAFDDPAFYPEINGFPVISHTYNAWETFEKYPDVKFLYCLYRPDLIKERIAQRDGFGIPIERYANFIHQSAFVARSVKMGYGNIILAHSTVNQNVVFGNHNTVQSNTLIGHDCTFGDSNFVTGECAIGSNNHIGSGCFFGLNTALNNYLTIGNFFFSGMGSNVIKSVEEDDVMVFGNPAKPRERRIKPL